MSVQEDSRIDDGGIDAEDQDATAKQSNEQRARRWVNTVAQARTMVWAAIRGALNRWRVISLTVAVVVAVGLTGVLLVVQYRPDQQTNDAAARAAIQGATEGTVALLSYAPETVDRDLIAAKSHLTGEYLRYFGDFSRYFLAPAVRQRNVKATASVVRAAVAELHPDSAVVLEFVHQTTTSKDKPEAVLTTNNVRVTLSKIKEAWLIKRFEPV
jgi:Mce-associated membrane protein